MSKKKRTSDKTPGVIFVLVLVASVLCIGCREIQTQIPTGPTPTLAFTPTRKVIPTSTYEPTFTPTPLPSIYPVCVVGPTDVWLRPGGSDFPVDTAKLETDGNSLLGFGLWFAPLDEDERCGYVLRLKLDVEPLGAEYTVPSNGISQYCYSGCTVRGEISIGTFGNELLAETVDLSKLPPEKIGGCPNTLQAPCEDIFRKTLIRFLGRFWGPPFLIDQMGHYGSPDDEIEEVLAEMTGQSFDRVDDWRLWWKKQPTATPGPPTLAPKPRSPTPSIDALSLTVVSPPPESWEPFDWPDGHTDALSLTVVSPPPSGGVTVLPEADRYDFVVLVRYNLVSADSAYLSLHYTVFEDSGCTTPIRIGDAEPEVRVDRGGRERTLSMRFLAHDYFPPYGSFSIAGYLKKKLGQPPDLSGPDPIFAYDWNPRSRCYKSKP